MSSLMLAVLTHALFVKNGRIWLYILPDQSDQDSDSISQIVLGIQNTNTYKIAVQFLRS